MARHQIPTPEELDDRARPGSLVDLERQRIEIAQDIDRLLLAFGGDTAEALSEAQSALVAFGDLLRVAIRTAGSS